jgi:hypothetical protein
MREAKFEPPWSLAGTWWAAISWAFALSTIVQVQAVVLVGRSWTLWEFSGHIGTARGAMKVRFLYTAVVHCLDLYWSFNMMFFWKIEKARVLQEFFVIDTVANGYEKQSTRPVWNRMCDVTWTGIRTVVPRTFGKGLLMGTQKRDWTIWVRNPHPFPDEGENGRSSINDAIADVFNKSDIMYQTPYIEYHVVTVRHATHAMTERIAQTIHALHIQRMHETGYYPVQGWCSVEIREGMDEQSIPEWVIALDEARVHQRQAP